MSKKKSYQSPAIVLERFETEDIITTSTSASWLTSLKKSLTTGNDDAKYDFSDGVNWNNL